LQSAQLIPARSGLRVWLPVEHRNFAKHLAGMDNREHDLLAASGRHADPGLAAENGEHAIMQRPHQENGVTGIKATQLRASNESLSLSRQAC
jgi:hypothetical protein